MSGLEIRDNREIPIINRAHIDYLKSLGKEALSERTLGAEKSSEAYLNLLIALFELRGTSKEDSESLIFLIRKDSNFFLGVTEEGEFFIFTGEEKEFDEEIAIKAQNFLNNYPKLSERVKSFLNDISIYLGAGYNSREIYRGRFYEKNR